ncbi:MAG: DmsC/YnfH family molybdoenzyme membrane anchor subunit [Paracoccaceae bacterium]
MHPAPSVIVFTTLSGAGFGFLAFLSLGLVGATGMQAFLIWALGYALAVGGLCASTFHLGNRQRAWRAFTQWRTSWLSREGWAAVLALLATAPLALQAIFGLAVPVVLGPIAAALCLMTVVATAMIYTQLATVPRWNHALTPVTFMAFALTGGAVLAGLGLWAAVLCVALSAILFLGFVEGDKRFAARGASLASATGLGRAGRPRVFAPAHTAGNYLMREMMFSVGRKHRARLRVLALVLAGLVPAAILVLAPGGVVAAGVAFGTHLLGALAARWLFFAEAEHVVGLYYGAR